MKRTLNENVLIFVLDGTLFITTNKKNYKISKNEYIFLKAGEEHFGFKKSPGHLNYLWVHFSDELYSYGDFNSNFYNFDYYFQEYGHVQDSNRLIPLFRQMMDFSLDNKSNSSKFVNYAFSLFMLELSNNLKFQKKENNTSQNSIVTDITNWIKLNFQKDFSLEDIANHINLDSNYLSKIFKTATGISILQYTTELRIKAAKSFLQSFTVKETAYSCGFTDEKYFMKVFKKIEGITPSQYKKAFSLKNINQ